MSNLPSLFHHVFTISYAMV